MGSDSGDSAASVVATLRVGLISGAVAGTVVDFTLFPLDTIKTRLQAGTQRPGSLLRGIYRGIGPALAASAPAAATFFGTYDIVKRCAKEFGGLREPYTHLLAAAAGDLTSSAIRVPFEKVKNRLQAGTDASARQAFQRIIASDGFRGLFRGYTTLALRELPFDLIQFPLYEHLKASLRRRKGQEPSAYEGALCGSFAGGFSAAVTTPLDVAKTRVMLSGSTEAAQLGTMAQLAKISQEEGLRGLFAGIVPRVLWISVGGFIFFGGYESTKLLITKPHRGSTADAVLPIEK